MGVLLGTLLPRGQSKDDSDDLLDLPLSSPWHGDEEIKIFRQYLRIPTVHPNINYGEKSCFFNSSTINFVDRQLRADPKDSSLNLIGSQTG